MFAVISSGIAAADAACTGAIARDPELMKQFDAYAMYAKDPRR